LKVAGQNWDIKEVDWNLRHDVLSEIRKQVFIIEQQVPQEEEWDGRDGSATHWLATLKNGVPVGTARLLQNGQIGRMAVLAPYRKLGIGFAMLAMAVEKAAAMGMKTVHLHAQSHAIGFYERAGFHVIGEEFLEAGIKHRMMEKLTDITN